MIILNFIFVKQLSDTTIYKSGREQILKINPYYSYYGNYKNLLFKLLLKNGRSHIALSMIILALIFTMK